MAKTTFAFTSFAAGELSPRLDGRTDLQQYFRGCRTLENMTVHPHGGVSRRPGTVYASEVKTSGNSTRLIPFEFSTTQTYMMEFGDEYVRFFKNNGIITESGKTITAITKANPGVVTANSHGYSAGDYVILAGIVGMTELNGRQFKVGTVATNTFQLLDMDGNNFNTSALTTYSSDGTAFRIYQIVSPYDKADLFGLKYAQSADVMYITHPNYPIKKLSRTGHTSWTLDSVLLDTGTDFTVSAITKANPGVVTTSANHGFAVGDFITFRSIGGMTQLADNLLFKVGTIPNATTFQLQNAAGTNVNTSGFGTFSAGGSDVVERVNNPVLNYATGNYPSTVSFFEQRLVFGGTDNNPQSLWFSKAGAYENFTTGVNATDAMIYTIASNQVNAIRFLSATNQLLIGTVGGEVLATSGSVSEPVTPTNIQITKQTNYGAANVDALQIANVTMFLQRAKRKIRELVYNYDVDGYVAPDMTILAEHITTGGLIQFAYQQEPDSILWAVRDDGTLLGLTYQRNEEVVAWHRHILGGFADTGKTIVHAFKSWTASSSTVSTANNTVTISSHGYSTGDPIYYYATANVIGGLQTDLLYFAIATNSNTLKFATTSANATAGTAVDITSITGSTVQYIFEGVNIATNVLYSAAHGLSTGDYFYYRPVGTKLSGLSKNAKYFVKRIDDNQFKVSASSDLSTFLDLQYAASSSATETDLILTDAKCESIGVVPSDDGEYQLWMVVNRFVNGATRRTVEYLNDFDFGDTQDDAFFMDSGLTYDSVPTTTLSGLDHLEGETVTILADGASHADKVVSGGNITLDRSAQKVHVGLGYTSLLQTLRIEAGSAQGVAQSKIKRINEITIRMHKTLGLEVGGDLDNMENIPFRSSSGLMNVPISLFSGDKTIEFRDDYNTDGHVFVRQAQPLPLTILAIYPEVTVYEG